MSQCGPHCCRVKGVTRAQVKLEEHEAIVTYDPAQAKIEDMIKAVSEAEGPAGGRNTRLR